MTVTHDNIVLVGLPEGVIDVAYQEKIPLDKSGRHPCLFYRTRLKMESETVTDYLRSAAFVEIPLPFPCKLVGIHSIEKPLGEEVLREVVKKRMFSDNKGNLAAYGYADYEKYTYDLYPSLPATESFASLLSHVKLYLSNPIEKPLPYLPMPQPTQEYNDYEKAYYERWRKWQEAQSCTFKKIAVLKRLT